MAREFSTPDKNSERKLLWARANRIKNDVGARIFLNETDAGDFLFKEGQGKPDEKDGGEWMTFTAGKDRWGYKEEYCRFRQTVTIPGDFAGRKVAYILHGAEDKAQQFIAYVNGVMTQGIDGNHGFLFLTDCAKGGEKFEIFLSAYCDDWEFKGETKLSASLAVFDEDANRLYYDLSVLCSASSALDADDYERADIVSAMNEAVSMLELNTPDEALYRRSVKAASEYLHDNIFTSTHPAVISAIGHTHIDTAYLWRLRQTREKAGRSFATVLNLMKEYPEYKFMSPQAQLYDFVKHDYPELYEEIRKAVREGRWEPEGSMWVESDINLISGESLVRQFLFGKRFFREEFGKDTKIMWLPDVFGYSGAAPQIMKKAGIEYFMTTKISWSEYTRFPFDTFLWEGIDGTKILSHFEPATTDDDTVEFYTTYNADIDPAMAIRTWHRYSNKDLNKNVLCTFGHGDGGGGPTRDMLERLRRLEEGIPGCPKTKTEFAGEFFDRLKKEVAGSRRLPKWRGELYLENHRGTLTSQGRNKRYNRKCEFSLSDTETLCTEAKLLTGADYPRQKINEAWKTVLLNQFHDIIPGSAIQPVYEDSKEQYEKVLADTGKLRSDALSAIASSIALTEKSVTVFNTLGMTLTEPVAADVPGGTDYTVCDTDGSVLPSQRTYDGKFIFLAKNVPPKGYKTFTLKEGVTQLHADVCADEKGAETDYISLSFDENMNIASLIHKESGRETAAEQPFGRLIAFEDRPYNREAWNIECYYDEKSWNVDDVRSASVIEKGPVRTVVAVERGFNTSVIRQYYIFYAHTARTDILFDVDWKEKNVALKGDYPVGVNTDRATFDIQFGNIERSAVSNTLAEFAQFEVCGQKWADLSDNGFGLSVLNDCKYGWTVKDGRIRPTMLRGATAPNHAQDRERHVFTYALYPHSGTVASSDVVRESYALNDPMTAVCADKQDGTLPAQFSALSCPDGNIVIETVKKAEDSDAVIVRLYEAWNRKTETSVRFFKAPSAIYECDLLEENENPVSVSGNTAALSFGQFEIKTLKILF